MKRIIIVSIALFLGYMSSAFSQQAFRAGFDRHIISAGIGGGISSLNFSPVTGSQSNGFGGNIGLGYHYFFNPQLSLRTGVDFALFNSKFNVKDDGYIEHSYSTVDYENTGFLFSSHVSDFQERQRAMMIQIPIMAQYNTNGLLYFAAGAKVGIPVSGKYTTEGNFFNSGRYSHENHVYREDPWLGFGTFDNRDADGGLELGIAVFASLEAGARFMLKNRSNLYVGIFFDYGLNNIRKSSDLSHFVDYQTYPDANYTNVAGDFSVNSVVQSQYINGVSSAFTDKLSPMAVGITCRLHFGAISFKKGGGGGSRPPRKPSSDTHASSEESLAEARRVAEEEAARRSAEDAARAEAAAAERAAAERAAEAAMRDISIARSIIERPTDGYDIHISTLDARQLADLDLKIALLKQYSQFRVYINGHTCNIGNDDVNRRVGMERAQRARAYLVSQGITEDRIITIESKLDREPLVSNTTEENRRINRRVQLLLAD